MFNIELTDMKVGIQGDRSKCSIQFDAENFNINLVCGSYEICVSTSMSLQIMLSLIS